MHVLSVYPIAQVSDFDTPSYRDGETAKPLNKAMMKWFVDKTISKPDDANDWRLARNSDQVESEVESSGDRICHR